MALQRLLLVRHSKAVESHAGGDRLRELSATGRERVASLLPRLAEKAWSVRLALTSPYPRARQTADLFLPALGSPRVETSEDLVPEADVRDFVAELRRWEAEGIASLAVFTHNPFVSELALWLLPPGQTDVVFHTPSLWALEFDAGVASGAARVAWVLHP